MNAKQESKCWAVIEQAIDEFGLSNVLDSIGGVCVEKAHHIRQAYGDVQLAKNWDNSSVGVAAAASQAMLRGL